jgi:AraC family transcriptional regulator
MPPPENTSATNLERYFGGKCLARGDGGEAWRDIKAMFIAAPPTGENYDIPAVSEPYLLWVTSGEIEIHDRENNAPWVRNIVKRGMFFFVTSGGSYDCRWRALTPEPFEFMLVLLEIPLFKRALEEVCGTSASHAHPRDVSNFADDVLDSLLWRLHDELRLRRKASPLFVQGIAQAIAIHLARNYATLTPKPRGATSPSLPGYKLRRITDWMAAHLADEFDLARLAARAGLSKFHFSRLFKNALGATPSRHHINLRMDAARRLLRETKKSILEIALEVGYTNPSHFAQLFRCEAGLSPSDYRRER